MSNKRAASIKAPLVGIVRQARGEQLFHRQLHGNGRPVNIKFSTGLLICLRPA